MSAPVQASADPNARRKILPWRLTALAVCLPPALLAAMTLRDPGLTWDEAIYFGTAVRYAVLLSGSGTGDWYDLDFDSASPGFKARYADCPRPWTTFSRPVVDFFWWQKDHPPLAKLAMGLSLRLFSNVDLLKAFRFPTVVAFAALLVLVYSFAEKRLGRRSGVFAALSLALMPRIFGHAHLGALDIPMALMWFGTVAAFAKGIDSKTWAAATGFIFGLALLTKINAILIPFALAPWGIIYHRKKCIPNLIAMGTIAPIVFFIAWPALWSDPVGRTWEFLGTAFHRTHIPVYYLGTQYTSANPPFHYPIALTLFTLPIGATIFAVVAVVKRIRSLRTDPVLGLLIFNICIILGSASLPTAPKYDGARLFLPLFPFIALLSAIGMKRAWDALGRIRLAIVLAIVYFGVQAATIFWIHPYELSYYSIACGGVPGAARLGMETTYWGEALNDRVFEYVRRHLPEGSYLELRHVGEQVVEAHEKAFQDFPKNVRQTAPAAGKSYLLLIARQGMFDARDWDYFKNHTPIWGVSFQGVPLCLIYRIEDSK